MGGERSPSHRTATAGCGSSPRGRGTLGHGARGPVLRRFIPAWAGNANPTGRRSSSPAVHPRVGGERCEMYVTDMSLDGSSPRGRGTPAPALGDALHQRFIPAWAGNACTAPATLSRLTVHPRVGGERRSCSGSDRLIGGSSPRGRGTQSLYRHGGYPGRFIPAWAGNARAWCCAAPTPAVHPRVGGERGGALAAAVWLFGSSPRGRGTLSPMARLFVVVRFIPAWAGNAMLSKVPASPSAVHPRVGGERFGGANRLPQ